MDWKSRNDHVQCLGSAFGSVVWSQWWWDSESSNICPIHLAAHLGLDKTRNLRVISEEVIGYDVTSDVLWTHRRFMAKFSYRYGMCVWRSRHATGLVCGKDVHGFHVYQWEPFQLFCRAFQGHGPSVLWNHWSTLEPHQCGIERIFDAISSHKPSGSPSRRDLRWNENNYTRNFNHMKCISLIELVTNEDARSAGGCVCISLDSKPPAIQVGRFQLILEIICQNLASNLAFVPGPGFKLVYVCTNKQFQKNGRLHGFRLAARERNPYFFNFQV